MEINRKHHVTVTAPRIEVLLFDQGKAQVSINLLISDGTLFTYRGGPPHPEGTVLPPGRYECGIAISAFNHGAFGAEYNSVVKICGEEVATAKGRVENAKSDQGVASFLLEVQ
jgi:hypothetical protein